MLFFLLISSCKNYASNKDLKSLEQPSESLDSKLSKSEQELKKQVGNVTGSTAGHQVQNQGKIGGQAWLKAKEFGLNVNYSSNDGTSDMPNGIIDGALKQIEKELKKLEEKKNKINGFQTINYEKQY